MNKKRFILLLMLIFLLSLVGCKGQYATLKTTIEGQGNIQLNPKQKAYKKGSKVKIIANPDQNWEFANWSGGLTGKQKTHQVVIKEDMLIKAKFKKESIMFRGGLANAGIYNGSGLKSSKAKWVFGSQTDKAASGTAPTVTDDMVYLGTKTGLSALDIETGKETWSIETNKNVFSVPAVVGDTIYFGSMNKYFYAVDRETGKINWKFKAKHWIETSPAVTDKAVYFGDDAGYVYGLDLKTGEKLGKFKVGGPIVSSPAVVGNTVYFASLNGKLYAVNNKTWEEKWSFQTDGKIFSSPAVVGKTVYFGSFDNHFYAVDVESGKEEWSFKAKARIASSAAVKDKAVWFGDLKGNIYVLNAETGKKKRDFKLQYTSPIISSPIAVGQKVYFGRGNVIAEVDVKTGNQTWWSDIESQILSSLVIKDGIIYFADNKGHLYALGKEESNKI